MLLEKDGEDQFYRSCEKLLHRVKGETNILRRIKRRKANWIGHMLREDCLLKHDIEGNLEGRIEVTGRRGRRSAATGRP
jgi:hypothetical protein